MAVITPLAKRNAKEPHSMMLSSKDSVLNINGLKMKKNRNTAEVDRTPNIANFSKGTLLCSSNLNFGLRLPIKHKVMARTEANITMLRMTCAGDEFGHPSAKTRLPKYSLSKSNTAISPMQPSVKIMHAEVFSLSIIFIFNLCSL